MPARPSGKLIFLVTEDWYFWSHRLPVARAARDAGFSVLVAARMRHHGERIAAEGFQLCPLPWRRRGDGVTGAAKAIMAIAALYRSERPNIVHHVALKPVLFGGAAMRLAFPADRMRPAAVAAIAGLGSGLASGTPLAGFGRRVLQGALRIALATGQTIVQNPEDGEALARLGLDRQTITLIRGSGVDTGRFVAQADPGTSPLRVALVSRMLRSKGVLDAVAAIRALRGRGVAIELMLVGPTDPDNRDSLDTASLVQLGSEPGIRWFGAVEDVPAVWRDAAIALLPSTYGEGVPKSLIEAAACARPIVATDMPGCREIVRHGETGVLVPPGDIAALTEAIAALAADAAKRVTMGRAARVLVEREFAEAAVAQQTLALYEAVMREKITAR